MRRIRTIEERLARGEWGAAESAATEAEREREHQTDALAASRRALVVAMEAGTIDPKRALLEQRALDSQLLALTVADQNWLTRRAQAQALGEAWREREAKRRALDELAKRARARHSRDVQAADNAEMDEVAGQRTERLRSHTHTGAEFDSTPETGSSPTSLPTD